MDICLDKIAMSNYYEILALKKQKKLEKLKKSGLRKCKGHWINKGIGVRNKDCYDENNQCGICGGFNKV